MTPCEKKGYKVGHKFIVKDGNKAIKKGAIVTLIRDDGDGVPLFKVNNINYVTDEFKFDDCWYISLDKIVPFGEQP